MLEEAVHLLVNQPELHADAREYLVLAGMSAAIAQRRRDIALSIWDSQAKRLARPSEPLFRLLRCHAAADSCTGEFRRYAER
jgi:hypothetical protein